VVHARAAERLGDGALFGFVPEQLKSLARVRRSRRPIGFGGRLFRLHHLITSQTP
jgi:hypothetical protein